ncbi:MAG: secretin N-terminal domain-containing protein [Pseudomonadota bacterium]
MCQRSIKFSFVLFMALLAAGCAQTSREYKVDPGRMETSNSGALKQSDQAEQTNNTGQSPSKRMTKLSPLVMDETKLQRSADTALLFPDTDKQQMTAKELPLNEFIQTVFGEVLGVNYILGDNISGKESSVTLNVDEAISSRRLFLLASELLDEKSISVNERDGIFYVTEKNERGRNEPVIGTGRTRSDIPDTIKPILQIIPLRYGITISIERTLRSLVNAKITADMSQNALFVEGPRSEIIRVIDLVSLLDVPSHRGKYVGLLELTYVSTEEFVEKITSLLEAEGIQASTRSSQGDALLMIPIQQIGAIALFAGDQFLLERAEYWADTIDKPSKGTEKRYYMYHPRYARASDLGQSVAPLIGGNTETGGNSSRDTQSAQQGERPVAGSRPRDNNSGSEEASNLSVSNDNIRMTVDERSNSLIFYTTGPEYQSLIPIVERLDVMPKQILLDATIAEVTLTDEFEQGFEFAMRNGSFGYGTLGAFGVDGISGFQMNWSEGVEQIIGRLSATTSLVNVLSNPTLVVRDGVTASISVGNDIPTIGATTSNPLESDRQTTVVNYRKTGVNLKVTPTINAQGLVVLEIDQEISNTAETGPSIQGSPSIFERSITTEVLAQSGQTILLGGLISENSSNSDSRVPGLGSLPLIGNLFSSKSDSTEKTELVIFITPRVIDSVDQWTEIRARIQEGLTNLKLAD